MLLICADKVLACDIDDTLVYNEKPEDQTFEDGILIESINHKQTVWPDEEIIENLKNYKAKGYFIILWSQSGYEWVDAIAKALNLTTIADIGISKVSICLDDLPPSAWITREYKKQKWTKKGEKNETNKTRRTRRKKRI